MHSPSVVSETEKLENKKKQIQLYELPSGQRKTPENMPDIEDPESDELIYKLENRLIKFDEAMKIQSVSQKDL